MFKVNKKVEYALMALKYVWDGPQGHSVTARDISKHYHIPFDSTARVMQIMAKQGLLHVEQGVHGGYTKGKDLNTVSFLALSEMLLGKASVVSCLSRDPNTCDLFPTCSIVSPMMKLSKRLLALCDSIYVGELICNLKENSATHR